MYTCIQMYANVLIQIYTNMYTCIDLHMFVTCPVVYVCICLYTIVYVCMYLYTFVYVCICLYTLALKGYLLKGYLSVHWKSPPRRGARGGEPWVWTSHQDSASGPPTSTNRAQTTETTRTNIAHKSEALSTNIARISSTHK